MNCVLTKQEILLGKGTQVEGNSVRDPGAMLCHMAHSPTRCRLMELVSRLSLANHPDSESFLVVHTLFSQDGCQREGFWKVVGYGVSPFDLS